MVRDVPLASIADRYFAKTPGSADLAKRAKQYLPGGVVSATRAFDPYGIYVVNALGTRKWDVDGNEYIDFFGGHGANILGHSHPVMVRAVQETVGRGVQYAANHPLEVELAELVVRLIPSAEKVRFTASGTEATLLAIRMARAYTGRSKLIRVATHYHGWHDHAASGYAGQFDGSPAPGVLPETARDTILVQPGDLEGLDRAVDQHGTEIAAIIAEPEGSHFGVVPTTPDFLRRAQEAAAKAGGLFILDEVLSGFRVALGGAQAELGLAPDLTTLAKVLCGGMPGGAVAGRTEVMNTVDHEAQHAPVLHQGTFTGNPVSMAAGLAVLNELERINGCDLANSLGRYARDALNEVSVCEGLPFAWYGNYSVFHLFVRSDGGHGNVDFDPYGRPMEEMLHRPQPASNRLRMALNVLGFDVNNKCSGLLSTVHTREEIDLLAGAVAEAGSWMRRENLIAQRVPRSAAQTA